MTNDNWLKVELYKTKQENLTLCRKNNLEMMDFGEHIEIYDKNDKLLKVVYSHSSLNFYLKSVDA